MYNGIGLPTPRGSGTNGHVSVNLSRISMRKKTPFDSTKKHYVKKEIRSNKLDLIDKDNSNSYILEHERKRKIESELFDLRCRLEEEKKLTNEEIEEKIAEERKKRYEKLSESNNTSNQNKNTSSVDKKNNEKKDFDNEHVNSHELKRAQKEKNEKFKRAFRIRPEFEENDMLAFDEELKRKRRKAEKEEHRK